MWSFPLATILYVSAMPDGVRFAFAQALYLVPMVALVAGASAGMSGWGGAILSFRPLVAIGRISYGVYLYHPFVAVAAYKLMGLERPGAGKFFLLYALTLATAAASWIMLERPILSLKRRVRTGAQAQGPSLPQ